MNADSQEPTPFDVSLPLFGASFVPRIFYPIQQELWVAQTHDAGRRRNRRFLKRRAIGPPAPFKMNEWPSLKSGASANSELLTLKVVKYYY
jgi:hypothetical protein